MAALVILAAVAAEVRPLVLVGNIDKFTAYIAQIVPVLRPAHLGAISPNGIGACRNGSRSSARPS